MLPLAMLVAVFCLTALASELFLRSRKLQSALDRVAVVNLIALAVVGAVLVRGDWIGMVPILIFWSGALLSWFGARSHLESSILLRMIHLLRERPVSRDALTQLYEAHYGRRSRIEELLRAGLLRADASAARVAPTRKGLLIVRLVTRLR